MPNFNIDERIAKSQERTAQLKRQKKEQEIRERKQQEAINTRRKIIVGGIVEKYFPYVLELQPRRTDAENEIEFAPMEKILSVLVADNFHFTPIRKQLSNLNFDE